MAWLTKRQYAGSSTTPARLLYQLLLAFLADDSLDQARRATQRCTARRAVLRTGLPAPAVALHSPPLVPQAVLRSDEIRGAAPELHSARHAGTH